MVSPGTAQLVLSRARLVNLLGSDGGVALASLAPLSAGEATLFPSRCLALENRGHLCAEFWLSFRLSVAP